MSLRRRGIDRQADNLPAARSGESLGVRVAQVIRVRLGIGGERPEHGDLVGIHISERRGSRPDARGPGALAGNSHRGSVGHPGPGVDTGAPYHRTP